MEIYIIKLLVQKIIVCTYVCTRISNLKNKTFNGKFLNCVIKFKNFIVNAQPLVLNILLTNARFLLVKSHIYF